MKAWYDDIDCATLQRIKAYSAFNDATSKNLMIQTMYEYREKEIKDFKETNHELAELCIQRKKQITELEKSCDETQALLDKQIEATYKIVEENNELKEKLAGAERTRDNLVQLGFPTFQSCKKYADKLTEAKAIIRKFVEWANWQGNSKCPSFKSIQDKAEQFLEGLKYEYRRNN